MFKNTKFKIMIFSKNNPNTVTTYTDIRFAKLIEHVKHAMNVGVAYKVYIKFYERLPDGRYTWLHPYFEFCNYESSKEKYHFYNHDDFGNDKFAERILKHIDNYERRFNKLIEWY